MKAYEIQKECWSFKLAPQLIGKAQQAYICSHAAGRLAGRPLLGIMGSQKKEAILQTKWAVNFVKKTKNKMGN